MVLVHILGHVTIHATAWNADPNNHGWNMSVKKAVNIHKYQSFIAISKQDRSYLTWAGSFLPTTNRRHEIYYQAHNRKYYSLQYTYSIDRFSLHLTSYLNPDNRILDMKWNHTNQATKTSIGNSSNTNNKTTIAKGMGHISFAFIYQRGWQTADTSPSP